MNRKKSCTFYIIVFHCKKSSNSNSWSVELTHSLFFRFFLQWMWEFKQKTSIYYCVILPNNYWTRKSHVNSFNPHFTAERIISTNSFYRRFESKRKKTTRNLIQIQKFVFNQNDWFTREEKMFSIQKNMFLLACALFYIPQEHSN